MDMANRRVAGADYTAEMQNGEKLPQIKGGGAVVGAVFGVALFLSYSVFSWRAEMAFALSANRAA